MKCNCLVEINSIQFNSIVMHYIRHKCINTGEVYYTYIILIQTFITTLESMNNTYYSKMI